MTFSERITMVDSIRILYPQFIELLGVIEDYHLYNKKIEPDGLFISADTGAGKSTLKDEYTRRYPRKETEIGTVVEVLSSSIPPKATISGTAGNLLRDLGDPMYERGTIDSKTARLQKFLKDCQVKLIMLDEINHLYDRDSEKSLKLIADWLKTLIIESNIPIVALGLSVAENVFNPTINPQLSRRFMKRLVLNPLPWNPVDENSIIKFLYFLEQKIPLMGASNLFEEDVALKIFYATDGSIAHIMTLVRQGTRLALKQKQETLSMSILATIFSEWIKNDKPHKKVNPFEESLSKVQQELSKESESAEKENSEQNIAEVPGNKATNKRIRGGKKKNLGVSDVL